MRAGGADRGYLGAVAPQLRRATHPRHAGPGPHPGGPQAGGAADAATRHSGRSPAQTLETTRQNKQASAAPDLVGPNFTVALPNLLWVADLTYIKTPQGILYLAVILDVFSRKVVGWQMADRMTTDLVLSALEMGLWRREVVRDRLIHHSDKASNTPRCDSPNASPTPASPLPPDRSPTASTTRRPNRSSAP